MYVWPAHTSDSPLKDFICILRPFLPYDKGFLPVCFTPQAFGVNSIALGDNSKAYGDNSKGYGDRIHPYKKV